MPADGRALKSLARAESRVLGDPHRQSPGTSSVHLGRVPRTAQPGFLPGGPLLLVLFWRIPGTGEPGGLPSLGSHRARHD